MGLGAGAGGDGGGNTGMGGVLAGALNGEALGIGDGTCGSLGGFVGISDGAPLGTKEKWDLGTGANGMGGRGVIGLGSINGGGNFLLSCFDDCFTNLKSLILEKPSSSKATRWME